VDLFSVESVFPDVDIGEFFISRHSRAR